MFIFNIQIACILRFPFLVILCEVWRPHFPSFLANAFGANLCLARMHTCKLVVVATNLSRLYPIRRNNGILNRTRADRVLQGAAR